MTFADYSVDQYKKALVNTRDKQHISRGHPALDMLLFQAGSEGGKTTFTKMAEHVNYPNFNSANLVVPINASKSAENFLMSVTRSPQST